MTAIQPNLDYYRQQATLGYWTWSGEGQVDTAMGSVRRIDAECEPRQQIAPTADYSRIGRRKDAPSSIDAP